MATSRHGAAPSPNTAHPNTAPPNTAMTSQLVEPPITQTNALNDAVLAQLIGVPTKGVPAECSQRLAAHDLSYEVIVGMERESLLLDALRTVETAELAKAGPERVDIWEKGWGENLRQYEAGGFSDNDLIPKYNHHRVLRLSGDYVRVADEGFEYAVYSALRQYYFQKYFTGLNHVTEFGCGTGTSLIQLAEMFPCLQIRGCDWARSSQSIIEHLGANSGRSITGTHFDMFKPDRTLILESGSAVFTSAALEQIGPNHSEFVDYLLNQDTSVCVHIEPLLELYDDQQLFDVVASRYHQRRSYLSGFLPRLRELEDSGQVEILEVQRSGFGSFFHEGYSVVVWQRT